MKSTTRIQRIKRGYLLLLALVFGAIFVTVFSALAGFVLSQNKTNEYAGKGTQARLLAESGIEYYRWFLAHFPGDATHGTGSPGPYSFAQQDAEGNTIGTITLSLSEITSCGETTGIAITSTGTTPGTPSISRTISARYAQPTVALYGEIVHDSVWIRAERALSGIFHSNGGVRMDGTATAHVQSSLASWNCTSAFGCSPANATAPGVLGDGSSSLWQTSTPQIDFEGMRATMSTLKERAQESGTYFGRVSTGTASSSPEYWNGYHLIFGANGTVEIRQVHAVEELPVVPVVPADGTRDFSLILDESTIETRTLSANCGLIFIEDNVWIEGAVSQKVTVVAANAESAGLIQPNIYIEGNITKATSNGSSGLTALAARNVLLTARAPDDVSLQGIFIATLGAFGRNLYSNGESCDSSYEPRSSLSIKGTVVSNKTPITKWYEGCSGSDGGYMTRTDSYDRQLGIAPPPFTPTISSEYKVFDWSE